MTTSELKDSYQACRQITKQASSNFYLSSRLFDLDTRRSIRALYAYCRTVDDIADSRRLTPAQKTKALDSIEAALKAKKPARYAKKIWPALYDTMSHHKIPEGEILEVLSGVRTDIDFIQPRTLAELDRYSYQVAGVVGVMTARILGSFRQRTLEGAKQLGIGMQYINIIRDVGSDAEAGRVYIPLSVLKEAGCSTREVIEGTNQAGLSRALTRLHDRAVSYFDHSKPALLDLHPSYQRPVRVATELYRTILDRMKQKQYTVREERISLSRREKLTIAWQAYRQ